MSIYANVSTSHLNQIYRYYEGYNKNSLSYISNLKFGEEEVKDIFILCTSLYTRPLKERIARIVNKDINV